MLNRGLRTGRAWAAALACAALLAGCATQRAGDASTPQAAVAPDPIAPRWDGALDAFRAADLFDAACLSFAPRFESAAALHAAGFRAPPTPAQAPPGAVFAGGRPDGASAYLARSLQGEGGARRVCVLSVSDTQGATVKAVRAALAKKIPSAFPDAETKPTRRGWRATDKETGFDVSVSIEGRPGRVLLTAAAVE